MKKYILSLSLLASCGGTAVADVATTTTEVIRTTVGTNNPTTTIPVVTTIPVTTTIVPNTPCAEWYTSAIEAGWTPAEWPTLSLLAKRESTCNPDAFNTDDPNGGSRGLVQINGIWCRWFLQQQGVLETCDELFDPTTNFAAARAIWIRQGRTFAAWGL